MSDQKKADNSRAERLRAALRENLKRRKAQAKGRRMQPDNAGDNGPAAPGSPNSAGFAQHKPKG